MSNCKILVIARREESGIVDADIAPLNPTISTQGFDEGDTQTVEAPFLPLTLFFRLELSLTTHRFGSMLHFRLKLVKWGRQRTLYPTWFTSGFDLSLQDIDFAEKLNFFNFRCLLQVCIALT